MARAKRTRQVCADGRRRCRFTYSGRGEKVANIDRPAIYRTTPVVDALSPPLTPPPPPPLPRGSLVCRILIKSALLPRAAKIVLYFIFFTIPLTFTSVFFRFYGGVTAMSGTSLVGDDDRKTRVASARTAGPGSPPRLKLFLKRTFYTIFCR